MQDFDPRRWICSHWFWFALGVLLAVNAFVLAWALRWF